MPTYITRPDGMGEPAEEATLKVPAGVDVRSIRIRWDEVSLFDADGRESVLIQRGRHPGAGLGVNFADHVHVEE